MTVAPDTLAHVLRSIEVRPGLARRETMDAGALLPVASDRLTLVYVVDGTVISPLAPACLLDVDRRSSEISARIDGRRLRLHAGDAFLSLGARPFALEAATAADVRVVDFELAESARPVASALPELITITGFDALEPAAAALAANMGATADQAPSRRSGDPVICRMMVTTLVLSVIRAWAELGCAPDGWPRASDPFLARVVAAIHEEPGREWTLDQLALIGAMSRTVFAERFRRATGRSPARYVTQVRMDAAKRMLRDGHSVSETSRALGYASDEGFSRAFRRHTGMPPSAWHAAVPA